MTRTILLAAALATAAAAQPAEHANIYFLVGPDTITVERVARTAGSLSFQILDVKRRTRVDLTARAAGGGLLTDVEWRAFASPTDTAPAARATVAFSGDSARIDRGGSASWVRVGAGALPGMNVSGALLEQALLRARAVGGDSLAIPVLFLPGGPAIPMTVLRRGDTTYTLRFGIATMEATVSRDGLLQSVLIPAQNARYVRGPDAPLGSGAPPKDYSPPPGAPYSAQDVAIRTAGGLTLRGTLTLPQRAAGARVPAVVTITGSGTQDRDETLTGLPGYRLYYQLADTLGRRGIAVLRLDDRGGGSDGSPASPTPELAGDIRAAVEWLRARAEIDPRRIGLVGHSEGGIIAPMVASADSGIAAVVLLAGTASTGRAIVEFQQRYVVDSMARLLGQAREQALAQQARATDSVARAQPWWGFFLAYDPSPTAGRVRAPVLILQGENDYQVPAAEAEKLAAAVRAGGNRDVTARVLPGLNHLFLPHGGVGFSYEKLPSLVVGADVMGVIAEWLASRLTR